MKKLITLFISVILLLAVSSCGTPADAGKNLTCYLEVRCDDALSSDALSDEKRELLPEDGAIIEKCEVKFSEGDSAFDIIIEKLREENIHFEFSETTGTTSKYIEGISNLYQFDCGEYSGWGYLVNGEIPSVAASEYMLSDGDEISFSYISDFMAE